MTAYWRRPFPGAGDASRRSGSLAPALRPVAISRFRGTVVIALQGDLDRASSAVLASTLDDLIDGQGNLAVVVDLREVRRIDGSGIDVLASASQRISQRGGELRLGGPAGLVFDALVLSGLARLVDIPFERELRPSLADRPDRLGDAAERRAGITSHPAGKARHHRGD